MDKVPPLDKTGNFKVSTTGAWADVPVLTVPEGVARGKVTKFAVKADGSKELLFDGKAVETRTADIGWDPATRTVYVPTFFKNTVIAFKVE